MAVERGKDRFNDYRRHVFTAKVSELVKVGYTADRACELIYSIYGHKFSVTKVVKRLISETKFGGH